MTFGELLKKARKKMGYSQEELAKLVGVNRVAITNYELNKNTPTHSNLKKIVSVLGLSSDYFSDEQSLKPVAKVPVIGETSCGSPISSSFQDHGRTCYYRGDVTHPDLYCVIASGESMAPEIEDGDEIICDPRVKVQHGDLVHYEIHGESAVKLYTIDEEANIIQFVPYNPSPDFRVRTVRLDDEEAEELKIVKVVSVNKLKFNNRTARLKLIGRS